MKIIQPSAVPAEPATSALLGFEHEKRKILALLPQGIDFLCKTLSMTDHVTVPYFGPNDHV
jgi:hypothetical protein